MKVYDELLCLECKSADTIVLSEFWDWDVYCIIYGCKKCGKLWKYERRLESSTTELLYGNIRYRTKIEEYDERYADYQLLKNKLEKVRKIA